MKLAEWNFVLSYADSICLNLSRKYLRVSYKTYSSSCNPSMKGISFKLLDDNGELFKEFSTGAWLTPKEYIYHIDRVEQKITDA